MFDSIKLRRSAVALGAAALTALGVGGVAVAQSGDSPAKTPATAQQPERPGQEQAARENSAADPDNVQSQGQPDDRTEAAEAPGSEKPGTENSEKPGTENSEKPGTETEAKGESSEVPNDDGPDGHADELKNPKADHQFQGVE